MSTRHRPFLGLVLLAALAGPVPTVAAQSPASPGAVLPEVRIPLVNGDVLTAAWFSSTADSVTVAHPVLGVMTLTRAQLALAPGAPLTAEGLAVPPEPPPGPTAVVSPWSGSIDFGVNGSSGNTDEQDARAELKLRHEDDEGLWDSRVLFQRSESGGAATADRRFLESRYTWDLQDSRWGPFVQGSFETDRFKDFDSRVSAGGGVAYTHRDDETTRLVTRYGLAVVATTGGMDDGTSPEAILGLDYERRIDEAARFVGTFELLPELSDLGEFRARGDAALEWTPDHELGWLWKLGVAAEHDSTPGTAKETDLDYFLSFGRRF